MQRRRLISVHDVAPAYEVAVGKLLAAFVASEISYGPTALSAATAFHHGATTKPSLMATIACTERTVLSLVRTHAPSPNPDLLA